MHGVYVVQVLVAGAGKRLEPRTVQHVDDPAAILDEMAPLKHPRRHRDSSASDAKHLGEEFVG